MRSGLVLRHKFHSEVYSIHGHVMPSHIIPNKVYVLCLVELSCHVCELPNVEGYHKDQGIQNVLFLVLMRDVLEAQLSIELIIECDLCKA
jgi:hypothetical protein